VKREILVWLLMLVVAGASAHAEGFFDDGDTLNYTCREEEGSFARGACLGTVSGALDMMRALGYVCKLEGVTREQAKDAVLKYLADHPEKTKVAAVFQIIRATEAAFHRKAPAALQPR
jgi:hypothetical protein